MMMSKTKRSIPEINIPVTNTPEITITVTGRPKTISQND
jgi:hypothetical protein